MGIARKFSVKVVGLSFVPGYPDNIMELNAIAAKQMVDSPNVFGDEEVMVPILCRLVRNPSNEFDSNAIEVHVPSFEGKEMLGHIPAAVSSRLAPLLDAGESWSAAVTNILVDPQHPDNPGILIEVEKAARTTDAF